MNTFVFNSFKEKFLNGKIPNKFAVDFIPMNNKFLDNFTRSGFSIEQFRDINDLKYFKDSNGISGNLFEDSKLKYNGIKYTWSKIYETEEQIKPMYINKENFDEFKDSEYWAGCSANSHIANEYVNSGFYILRTKEELNWFANEVNDGNNGIIGVLIDDVEGKINSYIGKDETIPFQGIMDGNGHALYNSTLICTGSDNGFIPVLGSRGIVRNFKLTNDVGYTKASPVLINNKLINLNYLKNDARDVNAGLLVGRNYGLIENVILDGNTNDAGNQGSFLFNALNFVPQVYSVSNKSDAVNDFTTVRQKYDCGENFFFLNSWCINSPGNICPYVGYFAEGIFAQQAYGYSEKETNEKARSCIEFNPKMKSFYDTGAKTFEMNFEDENFKNSIKEMDVIAIYMKYDWAKDNVMANSDYSPDIHRYNNDSHLDYVILDFNRTAQEADDNPEAGMPSHDHFIFDNLDYRYAKNETTNTRGLSIDVIETLKSDPTWLSYNDDPRGRNAVAIVRCELTTGEYFFFEFNGIYINATFYAGYLNVNNLPQPVTYGESDGATATGLCFKVDNDQSGENADKYYNASYGYMIAYGGNYDLKLHKNNLLAFNTGHGGIWPEPDRRSNKIDYEDVCSIDWYDMGDLTEHLVLDEESIRVFDKDGRPVSIKTLNGFTFRWDGKGTDNSKLTNKFILTNVVANTNVNIIDDNDVKIRFASKRFAPISLKKDVGNNTHDTTTTDVLTGSKYIDDDGQHQWFGYPDDCLIQNFNDKFALRNGENNKSKILIDDVYAISKDIFRCSYYSDKSWVKEGDYEGYSSRCNAYFLHANDYKQFIMGNIWSTRKDNSICKLFNALMATNPDTTQKNLIKKCFEKVKTDGNGEVHYALDDADVNKYRKQIYLNIKNNLATVFKHEVDYTNVSYASQIDDGKDDKTGRLIEVENFIKKPISRHFIWNDESKIAADDNKIWKQFAKYMLERPYYHMVNDDYGGKFAMGISVRADTFTDGVNEELRALKTDGTNVTWEDGIKGSITIEPFTYEMFMYSPFISCCNVGKSEDYNVTTTDGTNTWYIFDAGAMYPVLTCNGAHKEYLQKAAELYVANPNYYGLDYEGHWTTMAVRTSSCSDDRVNQLNFNWNIMRKMYEDRYWDMEDKEPDDLVWDGIYYDDYVFPTYSTEEGDNPGIVHWEFFKKDQSPTKYSYQYSPYWGTYWKYVIEATDWASAYDNEYSKAGTCIPKSMLNKPIRMHNMVRAAYNISPIVGANYGTVSSVSGNVYFWADNNVSSNFVGFLGTVAGKNVNGTVKNVKLNVTYNLTPEYGETYAYAKYKNTPILPYQSTQCITIPEDPERSEESYDICPIDIPYNTADITNYEDILTTVNCISFYNSTTKEQNPLYIADKKRYDEVKDFRFFTSAWYDDSDDPEGPDVINYKLKPIYVLGGIAGRVVASNATVNNKTLFTDFENIQIDYYSRTTKPYNANYVDFHSNYGSLIGQVDVQTTDTNRTGVNDLVKLNVIAVRGMTSEPTIGSIDYQPVDISTVGALRNEPRGKGDGNDYDLPDTHTLYAIDVMMNLDMKGDDYGTDELFSLDPPCWANINQSSGAFINAGNLNANTEAYCRNVFANILKFTNVKTNSTNEYYHFGTPEIYKDKFGYISINSILGSNTIFEPAYKFDTKQRKFKLPNSYGPTQEDLRYSEIPTRFYERNYHSAQLNVSKDSNPYISTFSDNGLKLVNNTIKSEDKYFSYTYETVNMTDYETSLLSGNMFNNIPMNWDENKCCYYADFGNQDNCIGDELDYSYKNNLVFGRSMAPEYIRSKINEADKSKPKSAFTSVLFSAYQYKKNEDGEYVNVNGDVTTNINDYVKEEAIGDNQLGGFLVYIHNNNDLMMYVSNDNGAEIDGRSYNLAFPTNNASGGIILNVSANNTNLDELE